VDGCIIIIIISSSSSIIIHKKEKQKKKILKYGMLGLYIFIVTKEKIIFWRNVSVVFTYLLSKKKKKRRNRNFNSKYVWDNFNKLHLFFLIHMFSQDMYPRCLCVQIKHDSTF